MEALFLSHNGMTEPLGQSQVLPYLRGLAASGVQMDLYACEPPGTSSQKTAMIAAALAPWRIHYVPLHRQPTHGLGDKLRDSSQLLLRPLGQIAKRGRAPRIVHARSQLPSAVGEVLCTLFRGSSLIFDLRGLLAAEYVDMGNWQTSDLRYRLATYAEQKLLRRATRVVVLTEAMREELCEGVLRDRKEVVTVIPCCVDEERFQRNEVARKQHRAELGLVDEQPLLCFAGSTARYNMGVAAQLLCRMRKDTDARFLLLSRSDAASVRAVFAAHGCAEAFLVKSADPNEVPGWLSAADLAVACLKDSRSSIATSPTKIAECLACELPTVVSSGIADGSRVPSQSIFPVQVDDQEAIAALSDTLLGTVLGPGRKEYREAARRTALMHYSLPEVGIRRYQALYRELS